MEFKNHRTRRRHRESTLSRSERTSAGSESQSLWTRFAMELGRLVGRHLAKRNLDQMTAESGHDRTDKKCSGGQLTA